MKTYKFEVVIECKETGTADLTRVSTCIEHTLQPLLDDEYFIHSLGVDQTISLSVNVIE